MSPAITGVYCAAATPIEADARPALGLFAEHCKALLAEGCHGIALMGTTGEANSFSVAERKAILETALKSGIDAEQLLPGTSCSNLPEAVELSAHAVSCGVAACVMLPPFYYKGVDDEGLFDFYARLTDRVNNDRFRVILYHIPQVTHVGISHRLIERLRAAFPGVFTGIKDSSGDLENMKEMTEKFPGFSVLAGADPLLLPLLQAGGAGCITATSNLRADALRFIWDNWRDDTRRDDIDKAQGRINDWRNLSNSMAQLPVIKAMIARQRGDDRWTQLRPPLRALSESQKQTIWQQMQTI